MIRENSGVNELSPLDRRSVLRLAMPAAVALAGAATIADMGAGAADAALSEVFGPDRDELQGELADRLDRYLARSGTLVEASVAVERGGVRLEYRPEQAHIIASVVKMEILAMVQQYWGSVEAIPEDHRELLRLMITESNNEATTELFDFLGRKEALDAAHGRYGLQGTVSDPQDRWGLTESTAPDQLAIANLNLFEGALDAEQADFGRELMGEVVDSQSWGVSAAAAEGESVWLKNGWDVESRLGGLWVVNSVGVLAGGGEDPITMAVLTSGALDDVEGVPIVEAIAGITREIADKI